MSKIAMACDHAAYQLKEYLKKYLTEKGYIVEDFGTFSEDSCDYPDYAHPAAKAVETNECHWGVAMCGSGNGIAMTLNKHQGIRAALCWLPELGELAKKHNNANILVLPARFISQDLAVNILNSFMNASFEGGRHQKRIDKIPVNIEVEGEIL